MGTISSQSNPKALQYAQKCPLTNPSKPEHQRLEHQHNLFIRLTGNKLFHAPLHNPTVHKTLDIGCGTGAVTHEMGSLFPHARVYGVDLSPVPQVWEKLPNISYV